MYLLKSSHNLGNTDERAQGYELRSPAGEETRAGIYLQASSLLSPLELAGPSLKATAPGRDPLHIPPLLGPGTCSLFAP